MWTDYFKFVKLRRGRVITPSHGEIDFSRDDIPMETCKKLYDLGFPYLELTELGKKEIYEIVEKRQVSIKEPKLRKRRDDLKSTK
jgi:hypothetical protein